MAKKRARRDSSGGARSGGSGNGQTALPTGRAREARPTAPAGAYGPMLFPPLWTTLARSFAAVGTSATLLAGTLLVAPVFWGLLTALGMRWFQAPLMSLAAALPPVGTQFDYLNAGIAGSAGVAFALLFGLTIVRSMVIAILVGMADEAFHYGRVSAVGVIRGLRASGTVLLYAYLNIALVMFGSIVAPLLGPQLGQIASQGTTIGGLFLFSFVPAIAVRLDVPATEAVARSMKAARMTGWVRHLVLVVIYYFFSVIVLPLLAPANGISANPTLIMWVYVLGCGFFHVGFAATFVFRWRAVESLVPAQTARKPRAAQGARGRR